MSPKKRPEDGLCSSHVLGKILQVFAIYKIIQFLVIALTPTQFDTSSRIFLSEQETSKLAFQHFIITLKIPRFIGDLLIDTLEKLVVWDNVYFSDLFVHNIKFEHLYVFCPLWWRFIKQINILGKRPKDESFYFKLFEAVMISNFCHLASAIVLFLLTKSTFSSSKFFTKKTLNSFALKASLLYVLSPSGVFLTSSYSEAPCAFLCFLALLLREISINYTQFDVASKTSIKNPALYILSGTLLGLAYGVRSNSILLGTVYLYDLYKLFIWNRNYKDSIIVTLTGSQLAGAMIWANYHAYNIFCPERGEWCQNIAPLLFTFAQSYYWDNGFLHYWTANNIPNFIFALPTIIMSLLSVHFFIFRYPFQNIVPILGAQTVLVILCTFFLHVQIITRVASFLPLIYWYLGSLDILNTNDEERTILKISSHYFVIWGLLQTAMFSAFLPPA